MIPGVNVTLVNGLLGGIIGTGDNITAIVLTGTGDGDLALGTPIKVVSVVDAAAQGIGPDVEPEAYKFVTEFYSIPGTYGIPVYMMLMPETSTVTDICDVNNEDTCAQTLLDFARGTIRVLGVSRTPGELHEEPSGNFIDSDVIGAVPNAQILAQAGFDAHKPLRVLLAARVNAIDARIIDQPNTLTSNKVGLVIGGTADDGLTSMGIILGRVAATAPHVNLGKVKDGALPVDSWFIGSQPILPDLTDPTVVWYQQLDQLVDAGYITVKAYANVGGLFISNDPMCVAETDDYCTLANGRVIDKASIIAYQTYVNEINDDVDLDSNNLLQPVVVSALEADAVNALNLNMSASMSGDAIVQIDNTQPITSTSTLKVKLRVQPKGYTKIIDVELGFNSPLNN